MKFLSGKRIYKADMDGSLSVEQQIEYAENDSLTAGHSVIHKFEKSLEYDIVRTVTNILSNATIKYKGFSDPFCISLQKNLISIFYALHDYGYTYLVLDGDRRITKITQTNEKGAVKMVDKAFDISGITQKSAVDKCLKMYGNILTSKRYCNQTKSSTCTLRGFS